MRRRRLPIAAAAAAVALTLLASACGRSLSSADSSAGNISPTANLVSTTPAAPSRCRRRYGRSTGT